MKKQKQTRKRRRILYYTLFFLFSTCFLKASVAQQPDSLKQKVSTDSASSPKLVPYLQWVTLGFGGGNSLNEDLFSLVGMYTIDYEHIHITARIISSKSYQEIKFPIEKMFDAGLLCGYGGHSTLCFASASVGLAYVFVNQRIFVRQDTTNTFSKDIYKSEISYNIGIPWQAHLFTKFSELSKTGIGLTIGGNINKSRSLFYVLFSLEIGTF